MKSSRPVLLIDFGSTFTKVIAVDVNRERVIGRAAAPTTVETDICLGLQEALDKLGKDLPQVQGYSLRLAASSAAGGLRMVAVGLVPELTAEAARRAALGAGARVLASYSYELTEKEVEEIIGLDPDVVLLSGGTDGGHRKAVVHNIRTLAFSSLSAPVVYAGNKAVSDLALKVFRRAGKEVRVTENVMPRLGEIQVEPARETIRRVFMERIIQARGLDGALKLVDGLLMPTPAAVLKAAELLALGTGEEDGLGDLVVVDVGGATTDVHSVGQGLPTVEGVVLKGLREPRVKRTVEGDLGVRVSAPALLEAVGVQALGSEVGVDGVDLAEAVLELAEKRDKLPDTETGYQVDAALARVAVREAVKRHAGRLQILDTPFGTAYFQYGKDLTGIKFLVGTGGVLVHAPDPAGILQAGLFNPGEPTVLTPKDPVLLLDQKYLLAAAGLLAEFYPQQALRILKKSLKRVKL